jgi:hypothetical protein
MLRCIVRSPRYSAMNSTEFGCPSSISMASVSLVGVEMSSTSRVLGLQPTFYKSLMETRTPAIPTGTIWSPVKVATIVFAVSMRAMNILYSLQHLGYAIPPQADAGWIGEAGPGPSYLDPGSGGPENDFTNRNTTFMTWNLMHVGRMIKDAGGIPAYGNQRSEWVAGCRPDHQNPEHR